MFVIVNAFSVDSLDTAETADGGTFYGKVDGVIVCVKRRLYFTRMFGKLACCVSWLKGISNVYWSKWDTHTTAINYQHEN